VAGIGKLGFSIQTSGANTPAEKLNEWIFLFLSFFGTFFLFIDLYLHLFIPKENPQN